MSTGVQILLIICLTIVGLAYVGTKYGSDSNKKNKKK